jgi:SNF2 family DNA or RNA helicase
MKTKGMSHQLEALRRSDGREYFALLMEQGTGKTWVLLAEAERLYAAGKIDALLVLAPNGVHSNWTRREIPAHLDAAALTHVWRAGKTIRAQRERAALLRPRADGEAVPLRVLAMNYDALNTKDGYDFAQRFLRSTRAMVVLDESGRVKNPASQRSKRAMALKPLAAVRRIANGTPIGNGPLDAFAQFEFLEHGLLGTTSYRAFVAEHAVLLDNNDPTFLRMAQRNPKAAHAQIVARDERDNPLWRNLERLQKRIEAHSFRVLKRDCLDLPPKVYREHTFELSAAERTAYDLLRDELRLQIADGSLKPVKALAALIKLQQISSGFVMDGVGIQQIGSSRLAALRDLLEDVSGQFIVWARFREELAQIAAALASDGVPVVEYHGGISAADRERAVEAFQSGVVRAFVAQQDSGGLGLTLTAATTVIYYSNTFSSLVRQQSEDRAHRKGTVSSVLYIDMIAEGTLDERILAVLRRKQDVAAAILDDDN